jgi:hypothetical protein
MELTPHLEAIRADLVSLLGADETVAASLERVGRALEATLQLRLIEILGEGALELTEQLPVGHTEVRVAGGDARLVYVAPPEDAPAPPPATDEDGGTARLTVRMPDALKASIEDAAEAIGVSVNAWLVQSAQSAVGRATEHQRRGSGNRISGYARS